MKKTSHYILCKKDQENELVYFNYDLNGGFKFKPKNKVEYSGIKVNEMVVINPSFIEKVLKRKIKRKIDLYLEYLIRLLDEEDEDPTSLRHALNDLEKYRRTVINKYRNYLDQKYIDLFLKKIEVLERELKFKIFSKMVKEPVEEEYEQERRRGR